MAIEVGLGAKVRSAGKRQQGSKYLCLAKEPYAKADKLKIS